VVRSAFSDFRFWTPTGKTETGCIVISNYPGMEVRPGSMGKPFRDHCDDSQPEHVRTTASFGNSTCRLNAGLALHDREPTGEQDAFQRKHRNGWYLNGDRGAGIDKDGYFWFIGRDDDVITPAEHLVSPFEVESASWEYPAVAESAVVSNPTRSTSKW